MKYFFEITEGFNLYESICNGGCGECQSPCQSACKTTCVVANQSCEKNKNEKNDQSL